MEKVIYKEKNKFKFNNLEKNKIISILGVNKKLKLIIFKLILNNIKKDEKILIINMDFLDINFKNNLLKNKNIDFLDGSKIIFENDNSINNIDLLKEKYNYILINTSYEYFLEYNKKLIELSDQNYFIINKDLVELKKATNLYKIYINEWKLNEEKIEIIIKNNIKEEK